MGHVHTFCSIFLVSIFLQSSVHKLSDKSVQKSFDHLFFMHILSLI